MIVDALHLSVTKIKKKLVDMLRNGKLILVIKRQVGINEI